MEKLQDSLIKYRNVHRVQSHAKLMDSIVEDAFRERVGSVCVQCHECQKMKKKKLPRYQSIIYRLQMKHPNRSPSNQDLKGILSNMSPLKKVEGDEDDTPCESTAKTRDFGLYKRMGLISPQKKREMFM